MFVKQVKHGSGGDAGYPAGDGGAENSRAGEAENSRAGEAGAGDIFIVEVVLRIELV